MDSKNKDDILKELIQKQRKDCDNNYKLTLSDLKRISNNLDKSIFDSKKCCIWKGYITNENNNKRAKYINFYYNHKKIALHRLLYINFVDNLEKNEYIKYECCNKGKCCNIHHFKKISKNKNKNKINKIDKKISNKNVEKSNNNINDNNNIVSFD